MPQIYHDNHATLSTLLEEASAPQGATLLIPDLQRPYVWTPRQVIVLVDSLLRGWPFGSLLLWSVSKDQVATMPWRQFATMIDRVAGTADEVPARQQPASYRMVLDGQQRVQSLLLAFGGDSWGFKLLDREWHQSLNEKRQRGRASKHWSFGELCLDLTVLKSELDTNRKLAAMDFTVGPLTWVVRSTSKQQSAGKRPVNYEYPLTAADDPKNLGRYVRLSRLWEIGGERQLTDSADFEAAVGKLFEDHKTPKQLADGLQRCVEDLLRKLREIRETRVTFLEVDKHDEKIGSSAVYMDAVVSIFTRLNTAGRTLSREEITFAWVKTGWQPDKVANRNATACFTSLGKRLKDVGVDLGIEKSLDDLMSGISFIWSVARNTGKLLTQRDLLDSRAVRPMASQVAEIWNDLEASMLRTSELIQQRSLVFGKHFQSLNALAVLWAWRFIADSWATSQGLKEVPRDSWDKILNQSFGPLADRWLICSQWAGYWGSASAARVVDCATVLAKLNTDLAATSDPDNAQKQLIAVLASLVKQTEAAAGDYIDRLSVDDRAQVNQYFVPLWMWHRLDTERWKNSAVPLRVGKKEPSHEVDHVVAVKMWDNLVASSSVTGTDDDDEDSARSSMNEIGNCLLLEKAFNISKSAKALGEWMPDIHEFKNGILDKNEWARSMSLTDDFVFPAGKSTGVVATAIETRTGQVKSDLKRFASGLIQRADL